MSCRSSGWATSDQQGCTWQVESESGAKKDKALARRVPFFCCLQHYNKHSVCYIPNLEWHINRNQGRPDWASETETSTGQNQQGPLFMWKFIFLYNGTCWSHQLAGSARCATINILARSCCCFLIVGTGPHYCDCRPTDAALIVVLALLQGRVRQELEAPRLHPGLTSRTLSTLSRMVSTPWISG